MPKLSVWHCSHEDQLFKEKEDYVAHLKELAWHRFRERKADRLADYLGMVIAKRQDHVRTVEQLEEFIDEYWEVAYEYSLWCDYKTPRDYEMSYTGCKVSLAKSIANCGGAEMQMKVDIQVDVKGTYYPFGLARSMLSALGFCSLYQDYEVVAGKWYRFTEQAEKQLDEQKEAHIVNEHELKIIAKLNGESYVEAPFTFEEQIYANC